MASDKGETSGETTKNDEEVIPGFKNVTSFSSQALRSLVLATKASNDLPNSGDDFDYYSSFEGFRDVMDIEGKRILEVLQGVMRYHGIKGNLTRNQDATELEDKFDVLVDANDQILERVGTFLDEAAGLKKQESALVIATMTTPRQISGSWNKKKTNKGILGNYRLLSAKHIVRPQLQFKEKVDNTSRPFIPKIKEKPHAQKPLHESLLIAQQEDGRTTVDEDNLDELVLPHPYQYELDHFVPSDSLLEKVTPQEALAADSTPLTFVNDEQSLKKMMDKLKKEKELAVDLEHHSYRTFQGLTCLMQISTRTEDFIVDTLGLRSEVHILNEVFADPSIVKVLHGADWDVLWLQRDLGLYLVNMFDTGQAARVLRLQRFSLAHLLWTYCSVQADKQYQLADWRIRPLPEELIKYAREDTHYLLYIYDRLRNELIDRGNANKNLLHSVLQRSTQLCAKKYEKPVFTSEKYMGFYQQSKKIFNAQQLHALKAVFAWRDRVARQEDESEGYVLPNHMLLQISELLPKEQQGILACCNPIPPLLRQSLPELHSILKEAREIPLTKPAQKVTTPVRPARKDHPKYWEKWTNPLYAPHDLSHQEKRQALPQYGIPASDLVAEESKLFTKEWSGKVAPITAATKPRLSAFSLDAQVKPAPSEYKQKAKQIEESFVSPYQLFLPSDLTSALGIKSDATNSTAHIWKLKPNTEKVKPAKVYIPEVKQEDKVKIDEEEEEAGVLSLNQIIKKDPSAKKVKKDKKQNKANAPKFSTIEEKIAKVKEIVKPPPAAAADVGRKRKKEKLTMEDVEKEGFQAHDYSAADFAMFAGSSTKKSKKDKKGKQKDYNPATVQLSTDHKNASKPRLNPLTGQKSMTFGQNKEKPQTAWPKR